jgi:hypothetical protein|tara:strand:+ start:817 stop:1080 length:264 start_codon:yes stop_codon:yes gene_type:complete
MIGYGGIIGIHLIDGHHLDMTDGGIITTDTEQVGHIVGIITDGQVIHGTVHMVGITIMDGIPVIIHFMAIIIIEEQVHPILMGEEEE